MKLLYQRIGEREGISNLLRHFYADVRQDPLIGPIFNAQVKDWKTHLEMIANFWETVIGGPRTYARPMPMKHLRFSCERSTSNVGSFFGKPTVALNFRPTPLER
jgi:hemoglobin